MFQQRASEWARHREELHVLNNDAALHSRTRTIMHCIEHITQELNSTTFPTMLESSPFESQLPPVLFFLSGFKAPTQSEHVHPIVHNVVRVRIIVDGLLDCNDRIRLENCSSSSHRSFLQPMLSFDCDTLG